MRRISAFALAIVAGAAVFSLDVQADQQQLIAAGAATCDQGRIDPASYRLTTEAQALNVLRPREPGWEP